MKKKTNQILLYNTHINESNYKNLSLFPIGIVLHQTKNCVYRKKKEESFEYLIHAHLLIFILYYVCIRLLL